MSKKQNRKSSFKPRRKNIGKGSIRLRVRRPKLNGRLTETTDKLSGKKKTDLDVLRIIRKSAERSRIRDALHIDQT